MVEVTYHACVILKDLSTICKIQVIQNPSGNTSDLDNIEESTGVNE
jgi:hypothetical protein